MKLALYVAKIISVALKTKIVGVFLRKYRWSYENKYLRRKEEKRASVKNVLSNLLAGRNQVDTVIFAIGYRPHLPYLESIGGGQAGLGWYLALHNSFRWYYPPVSLENMKLLDGDYVELENSGRGGLRRVDSNSHAYGMFDEHSMDEFIFSDRKVIEGYFPASIDECMISSELAELNKLHIGDTLRLTIAISNIEKNLNVYS
jgi:hypothetical protein